MLLGLRRSLEVEAPRGIVELQVTTLDETIESGRVSACVLRTAIGTIGVVRNIKIIRSPGRATDARSRAQAKGRTGLFPPTLKRYRS